MQDQIQYVKETHAFILLPWNFHMNRPVTCFSAEGRNSGLTPTHRGNDSCLNCEALDPNVQDLRKGTLDMFRRRDWCRPAAPSPRAKSQDFKIVQNSHGSASRCWNVDSVGWLVCGVRSLDLNEASIVELLSSPPPPCPGTYIRRLTVCKKFTSYIDIWKCGIFGSSLHFSNY